MHIVHFKRTLMLSNKLYKFLWVTYRAQLSILSVTGKIAIYRWPMTYVTFDQKIFEDQIGWKTRSISNNCPDRKFRNFLLIFNITSRIIDNSINQLHCILKIWFLFVEFIQWPMKHHIWFLKSMQPF